MESAVCSTAPAAATPLRGERQQSRWTSGPAIVLYVAAFKAILHLLCASRYGYFVDELYFLACSHHMAWGYVDQPPLIVFITYLVRHTFGESLFALRFLPALAGGATVWICGLLAREMGGGRLAQALAAVAALVAPTYLAISGTLMMNAFDPLIWAGCVYLLLQALQTEKLKYWIWLGLLCGLGFENKYLIALLVVGLVIGLALSRHRAVLGRMPFLLAALIALLVFAPNFYWQASHGFPFLEWQKAVRSHGLVNRSTYTGFLRDQWNLTFPAVFVWIAGIWYYLFSRRGRQYAFVGWAFVVAFTALWLLHSKPYYTTPAYVIAFPGGAILLEELAAKARWAWPGKAYLAFMLAVGALLAPLQVPILPIESVFPYAKALGRVTKQGEQPPFGQQMGWPEIVSAVSKLYHDLPPQQRARAGILAVAYGQAAAVDELGPKYGLPKAIGLQLAYGDWGPRNYTGDVLITIGFSPKTVSHACDSMRPGPYISNPYGNAGLRGQFVNVCIGFHGNLQQIWPGLVRYR